MSSNAAHLQIRTDVITQVTAAATEVLDTAQQQRWVLTPVEALVWQQLLAHPSDGIAGVVKHVLHQVPGCTSAQVWAAFDALADRHLLLNRPVPPAAERVSHHPGLNRRQWAVAGLALAASPMAFAATAVAAEEKAKADLSAPDKTTTVDAIQAEASERQQEQARKRQPRAQEELAKQKQVQRQAEAQKKQRTPAQEEEQKRQVPAAEQTEKQQVRKQEQAQKYDSRAQEHQVKQKASVSQPADEASKPF